MMASGVLLTGIVALLFVNSPLFEAAYSVVQTPYGRSFQPTALGWIISLSPLAFVLVLSFGGVQRFSKTTLQAMFWSFAVLFGLSMSTIFITYTGESIASAFFAASAAFAGLSLFGYTTKKNGHGLGLHSCAIAAQELNGSLRVLSDGEGKGATFILELPME